MNLRTTLLLVLLAVVGGITWLIVAARAPSSATGKTIDFLNTEMTADNLTRIEIARKGRPDVVLEKVGGEWTLPGKWPVRDPKVKGIVKTLTAFHSRLAPETVESKNLGAYGLDKDETLALKLTVAGKVVKLKIGEEPADKNRFTRATYLKFDDSDEVVRLGPGVVLALDRPQEYFQQRRLFPTERVAKDEDGTEKVEQVAATEIEIKGPDGEYTLTKDGKDWLVTSPTRDHADPDKLKGILANLGDLWADRFAPAEKPEKTGLDKPEYTIRVKRPSGGDITVLVGKVSRTDKRTVMMTMPPQNQFMPPKQFPRVIEEPYRYAKLPANDQIFETRAEKLKEIAPSYSDVRDARIARFKTDDVKKVTIEFGKETLVLVKDKEKWKIEKPAPYDAESGPVTELLDKLSGLEAKGSDIRDKEDPKNVGLDKPAAKITVELEETKKTKDGDKTKEEKTPRTLVYDIGTNPKEKEKVFIQLAGWPRINAVKDEESKFVKLVEREPLAYRGRRVLDVATTDLGKIQIVRGKDTYAFERKDGDWSLTEPVTAKVEPSKVERLVGDLARLETPEFLDAAPKAEVLDKTYGLAQPAIKATLTFADAKKPARTLLIGKQRPFKDDYYARLDDGPVMLLKKDVFEQLDRDSLAYRAAQAWQVAADQIVELRVAKEGQPFALAKQDTGWKVTGPFDATAQSASVTAMADELAQLKSEKYVSQGTKDFAKFGLDNPYLQFTVVSREPAKKDAKEKDEKAKDDKAKDEKEKDKQPKIVEKDFGKETTQTLQIGKFDESGKSRYARVGGSDAVFLVGDKALAALDKGPLDLLDRGLLDVATADVTQVRFKGTNTFTLEKQKGEWKVTGTPAPPFTAEEPIIQETLRPWGHLMAVKYAAYGPKIDWAAFGLDQPKEIVTISADKDKKAVEHSLALGKEAGKNERYARLDQQQAVVVLDAETIKGLSHSHLDFLDPRTLKFPFDAVQSIERKMSGGDIELAKRDDAWQIVKPSGQSADSLTVDDIVEKTFQLKARRVAAYPAKDMKPFGLEPPAATVTIVLNDGKKHVLEIGAATKENPDERYARIDGGDRVVVLGAELSKHLTAGPLYFADRNVASFGSADRLDVVRGSRKLVFVKSGTSWKLADPIKGDADDGLVEFLQSLFRLRADEIVAGKGADLKSFGLDAPEADWKIMNGDKETLALQIGAVEKGHEKDAKPRRYAKLGKGEQVFLLGAKQSGQALAEYRSRKPWDPSLDAVQIDQLTVTGPAGPFTLRKNGERWGLVDRPEANVATKTVTDALDALAGLKVERYIVDAKADLQLYGLEPPEWKLEAKTPSGTRTLLVGRAEGDSQRRYAAIAGTGAVFVIGAEDATRLVRPAASFLEEKKAP